jgi:hypothetical protein
MTPEELVRQIEELISRCEESFPFTAWSLRGVALCVESDLEMPLCSAIKDFSQRVIDRIDYIATRDQN